MDKREAAMLDLLRLAEADVGPGGVWPVFPWYDSQWLSHFVAAKRHLAEHDAEYDEGKLDRFVAAMSTFLVDPGTAAPFLVEDVVDAATLGRIRREVNGIADHRLERSEVATFGRDVVHDNPFFLDLQAEMAEKVSALAGEVLDVSYNFLSLYRRDGRCPVHMDAPEAKWTLDICVDQLRPWPIHISEVVDWPEDPGAYPVEGWEGQIIGSHRFRAFEMDVGQALLFAGSSQWHYRDPMPQADDDDFCTLLFFHFVPQGALDLVDHRRWPQLFDAPGLFDAGRGRSSR